MRKTLLAILAAAASLAAPEASHGITPARQLLLEANVDSIEYIEEAIDLLETTLEPGDPVDPVTEGAIAGLLDLAIENTELLGGAIADDPELTGAPERDPALAFTNDAIDQMIGTGLLIDGTKPIKAKKLAEALEDARDLQVATLTALQGRPDRFVPGRTFEREIDAHWGKVGWLLPRLGDDGIPFDRTLIFETFAVRGKPATVLERLGFAFDAGIGADFKGGVLGLRGLEGTPITGGVSFGRTLSEQYTAIASFELPQKIGRQRLDALNGFSAGLYVASDRSAAPASSFVIEHQTTNQGWVQSFVAQGSTIVATFPHGSPSLDRRLRTFAVRDGDSVRLGVIQRDGDVSTVHAIELPLATTLPYLSLYFRNGTKKTRVEIDNLMIFATPYPIGVKE
jgi:hypothetical protein